MATKKKDDYKQKAITTSIKFTSRASVKINDSYYTIEACEERLIPAIDGVNIEQERKLLWDMVNTMCDDQIQEILQVYKK